MSTSATRRRLEQELTNSRRDPPDGCWAQSNDNDLLKWTATIQGPEGSPYQDGFFRLRITYPDEYPSLPPSVELTTKIYHPNIDAESGFIGLNVLHNSWSPVLTISTILTSLRAFLSTPDPSDAVMPEIAEEYERRREEFEGRAREWTRKFAMVREVENRAT